MLDGRAEVRRARLVLGGDKLRRSVRCGARAPNGQEDFGQVFATGLAALWPRRVCGGAHHLAVVPEPGKLTWDRPTKRDRR